MRPKLLDLFCGEGGASAGYDVAGWDCFGLDNDRTRLKRYPYVSILAGWEWLIESRHMVGRLFQGIHASPPCTGYTRATVYLPDRLERYDRLIPVVREVLLEIGLPYVMENVADARPELIEPVMLCGRMFDLSATDTDGTKLVLDRHRLFECYGFDPQVPDHQPHDRTLQVAGAYAGARRDKYEARHIRRGGYVPASVEVQRELLDAPEWMSERGIQLSIPPIYAEHLGAQMLEAVS